MKGETNGNHKNFYPRPPRGGRLPEQQLVAVDDVISIHALREEGDQGGAAAGKPVTDFYPRPPRGGRRSRATPTRTP